MMLDAPLAPTSMPTPRPRPHAQTRLKIIDGDVHPALRSLADLKPYLPSAGGSIWRSTARGGASGMSYEPYPKSAPRACRRDAWPEDGGPPGSNLDLIRKQYLDAYGIEFGILGPLGVSGQSELNLRFLRGPGLGHQRLAARVLRAGPSRGSRPASSCPTRMRKHPCRDRALRRRSGLRAGVHADAHVRAAGNRRYWPIYAAAERHGLPVGMHVFGSGGHPYTGTGWPSYYVEEGAGHSTSCQTVVTSLVIEGVFERFPRLKVVIVEGGFAWLPPLAWRLDKLFERMRSEVPHLKRRPSEYIREHVWVTTQPMEEPDDRRQLLDVMEWIGWDRLLFASDYPHWDFDDPVPRLPCRPAAGALSRRSSPPTAARSTGSREPRWPATSSPRPPTSRRARASSCRSASARSSSSTSRASCSRSPTSARTRAAACRRAS